MRDFRKYNIWELSHKLTLDIYTVSREFPQNESYGIVSQIRRASASIPTNIAEGCGRDSDAEFNRFLTIAMGSASETEYLLILSKDLQYINDEYFENLNSKVNIIKQKIYSLKQKLK
ncbi:four helix bundle protein [uncultured Dokdonia sp.]|uniref:four helix bundle protein n=1 Tax=uncultured Dokdonia sp. TaxID=575653 RepID=UPI002618A5CE|nr:four helix bundle protein [uncultured Dokdonia sp.]